MPNWKDDLVRCLEAGDKSGAALARVGHLPNSVFRYHSPQDWRFQSLRTGIIWLVSPLSFNDPYTVASVWIDALPLTPSPGIQSLNFGSPLQPAA
jgi:hypothetical protein